MLWAGRLIAPPITSIVSFRLCWPRQRRRLTFPLLPWDFRLGSRTAGSVHDTGGAWKVEAQFSARLPYTVTNRKPKGKPGLARDSLASEEAGE